MKHYKGIDGGSNDRKPGMGYIINDQPYITSYNGNERSIL